MSRPAADLYQQVTDRIIAQLEAGTVPWVKPWKSTASGDFTLPFNASTRTPYSGINIVLLWDAMATGGHTVNGWMTFKQALALRACVRKGEKGTHIVFTKRNRVEDPEAPNGERTFSFLKSYTVFNVAQIDGLPEDCQAQPNAFEDVEGWDHIEEFISATGAAIVHG